MTSQINPSNINGAYPVAGQDNNSQGFRDNFTNTSTNFQYAAQEITDLQTKAVLKAPLTGTSLDNNMLNNLLYNALIKDFAATVVSLGNLTGSIPIDYSAGHFYTVGTSGSISLSFSNWPAAGQAGLLSVQITVTNTAYTVTLPTAVSVNSNGIQGLAPSTNIITFAAAGVYTFTFITIDGGTTITVNETNKALQPFNAASENLASGAASLTATTSYLAGSITGTLAAGTNGQIKVFTQTAAGTSNITVTNYGWPTGTGILTLNAQGESCTLQYTNGAWYCIGNNGATFA